MPLLSAKGESPSVDFGRVPWVGAEAQTGVLVHALDEAADFLLTTTAFAEPSAATVQSSLEALVNLKALVAQIVKDLDAVDLKLQVVEKRLMGG